MNPAEIVGEGESVVTISKFLEYIGTFGQLLVLPGTVLVLFWLVAGLRARFAGRDTARAAWWLTATVRVLWIGGIVGYGFALMGAVGDLVAAAPAASSHDFQSALILLAARGLPALVVPLTVAFAGAVAILLVGPPKQPSA